jgi:hypothetical protein
MLLYFLVELFEYGYKKAHARFDKEELALAALVLHPKCTSLAVMVVDPMNLEQVIEDRCSLIVLKDLRDYVFDNQQAQLRCDAYFAELDRKKRDDEELLRRNPHISERLR